MVPLWNVLLIRGAISASGSLCAILSLTWWCNESVGLLLSYAKWYTQSTWTERWLVRNSRQLLSSSWCTTVHSGLQAIHLSRGYRSFWSGYDVEHVNLGMFKKETEVVDNLVVCACTDLRFIERLGNIQWENAVGGDDLGHCPLLVIFLITKPKIATWLILPEVIRSSQRLSHACLSIKTFYTWNCEWLIISVIVYLIIPYYLDNCSNSRANTWLYIRLTKDSIY